MSLLILCIVHYTAPSRFCRNQSFHQSISQSISSATSPSLVTSPSNKERPHTRASSVAKIASIARLLACVNRLNINISTTLKMPNPTLWQCHECKARPHVFANTEKCLDCGHDYCADCKTDTDIDPALKFSGRTRSEVRRRMKSFHLNQYNGYHIDPSGGGDSYLHDTAASGPGPRSMKSLRLGARPSMAGWWKCHSCHYQNNPALAPEKCVQCAHVKCGHCT